MNTAKNKAFELVDTNDKRPLPNYMSVETTGQICMAGPAQSPEGVKPHCVAVPYAYVSLVEFEPGRIAMTFGAKRIVLVGANLEALYHYLLEQRVSAVYVGSPVSREASRDVVVTSCYVEST